MLPLVAQLEAELRECRREVYSYVQRHDAAWLRGVEDHVRRAEARRPVVSSDDEMSSDNESGGGSVRLVSSDDETWGKHSLLGVLRDGTMSSKERSEQQASGAGASASGESSPNEWMLSATAASLRSAAGYSRSAAALPLAAACFLCSRAFAA